MTAVANVEMAQMWDGEADEWIANADRYDATDRFIQAGFEAEVPIGEHDRVLDIGCGTGKSSRDAARRARHGWVLGVDLSSRMLEEARRRSAGEGVGNVEFLCADAQVHPFEPDSYDLAISVFGAMFFADTAAALANVRRSIRPGGRIAFLAWQRFEHNEWLTTIFDALAAGRDLPEPAAGEPGPFGLADPDAVTALLRDGGFIDGRLISISEPMWLGASADEAWTFVSDLGLVRGLICDLSDDARRSSMAELRRRIEHRAGPDGVLLESAAWLITARRP